jgi:hypothetical protein
MHLVNKHKLICLFFLWVISSSSCKLIQFTEEDLVGVWVEDCGQTIDENECACFEFFRDRKFSAFNYQEEYFILHGFPPGQRIDNSGEWVLIQPADPFKYREIQLTFDPNPTSRFEYGYQSALYFPALTRNPNLFSDIDNLGEGILLNKSDQDQCKNDLGYFTKGSFVVNVATKNTDAEELDTVE